jgi:hypothetical protein
VKWFGDGSTVDRMPVLTEPIFCGLNLKFPASSIRIDFTKEAVCGEVLTSVFITGRSQSIYIERGLNSS